MREGWLKLHIDRVLPLDQAEEAHRLLESRKTTGKIVLMNTAGDWTGPSKNGLPDIPAWRAICISPPSFRSAVRNLCEGSAILYQS